MSLFSSVPRRDVLKTGLSLAGAAAIGRWPLLAEPRFAKNPFTLGVASGDPWPDSVVLWTRLAPDPTHSDDMPRQTVPVRWRVASDEKLTKVVQQGTAMASPDGAHTVHVEVHGLQPGRWYWYQFDTGSGAKRFFSRIGRTRTASALASTPEQFRFAFVSCQKYETGLYTAFEHLCDEDLELVIHLGDYIYETGPHKGVRNMPLETSITLDQYRARYAFYKSDPTLQEVHARFPWAVVSDDHEVSNDYAGLIPEKESQVPGFTERRAAAYRAYYEHMPLRAGAKPHGSYMELYRSLHVGQLAALHLLDTRQYRSDQPCGDGRKPTCPERDGPSTMLGDKQQQWLFRQLSEPRPRWNVLAQQVIFSQIDLDPGSGEAFMMDKWDGYAAARRRVTDFLTRSKIENVVVLSGDNHNNWVIDVKSDPEDKESKTIASEFAGTSITSSGDGADIAPEFIKVLPANPQIKFHNSRRGYVRCVVTPRHWISDYRIVPYVSRPGAPIETRASFAVEPGRAGAVRA